MIELNGLNVSEQQKNIILDKMDEMGHEQVLFCRDKKTGLRAIIAIHDTTMGPSLGGVRMWDYKNELQAVEDVLRLSRGMTYKAAISGLELGGGKAVIIGNANTDKSEALLRRFGQFVESLGGRYITAEDVNMSPKDMEYIKMETNHVTGTDVSLGGSGDPSPVTAYGVYMGMKASAMYRWGSDSLAEKTILVQGIGHVGEYLVEHLAKENANILINDINEQRLEEVSEKYGAKIVKGNGIYDLEIDIYAPCALGATLNSDTIARLKCEIVAGSANNQLADEQIHANQLKERAIIYAPDFLINAGGLINVYSEIKGFSRDIALEKTKNIYNTTLEILNKAEQDGVTTNQAAIGIAQERLGA
ncbi:MAG: Glu/Leu/Phe/Val dehydrogenase dimerization domain-containing protein [Bacteroidota bacterium]|nr:Glu/Leu/Phe/Val dehydrogenase dimerization domain-containing protein [Bacteroidota bacterium]